MFFQRETLGPFTFKTHRGLGPTLRDSHLNGDWPSTGDFFFLSFPGDHNWESKLRTTGEPDLGFLAQKKPVLFLSLTW